MDPQKAPKLAAIAVLGFLGFLLFMSSYFIIDAGERGVVLRFGQINRIVDPGLRFKMPMAEEVVRMTVRVQKSTTKTEAASKDLQVVQTTMVLNYSLDPLKAGDMYADIGLNFVEKVIDPAVKESFKAAAAR